MKIVAACPRCGNITWKDDEFECLACGEFFYPEDMDLIVDADVVPRLDDDDFGCILNCAVRYALGRRTYIPKLIVDFITPIIPRLSNKTLSCFDRDIIEHGKNWNFGHPDIDEPVWMRFHAAVVQELGKRGA